jgi:hypothetical protein
MTQYLKVDWGPHRIEQPWHSLLSFFFFFFFFFFFSTNPKFSPFDVNIQCLVRQEVQLLSENFENDLYFNQSKILTF